MEGLWVWPADEKEQSRVIETIRQSNMLALLTALSKNSAGLSNAQLDTMTDNNSQWQSIWGLNQLISLGLVEYRANLFGDSGRYSITELGKTVLQKAAKQTSPPTSTWW